MLLIQTITVSKIRRRNLFIFPISATINQIIFVSISALITVGIILVSLKQIRENATDV